ncbi:hypothetical protein [Sulfitobacter mediterraneus]|uniref:hypothetical protein n=1 Tax=Sulfitobacter mediterraneus TaxID=83219 RepID=UPI0021A64772|nr:hypothetical protein [Sulfitobacter mediterraneus]UWR10339.1 hypothetical protein K3753_13900 [Sulfitobacter mediterraneus]
MSRLGGILAAALAFAVSGCNDSGMWRQKLTLRIKTPFGPVEAFAAGDVAMALI